MNIEQLDSTGYTGFSIRKQARSRLLNGIPPIHPVTVAHHVTYKYGVPYQLPPEFTTAKVIAHVANDRVQAAIVEIGGTTQRPDGGTFHITISLDKEAGAKSHESNDLIADRSRWRKIEPFEIDVHPKFFKLQVNR